MNLAPKIKQKPFRSILPSAPNAESPEDERAVVTRKVVGLRRRRLHVQAACNGCRAKKVACDGGKPLCDRCRKRKIKCEYMPSATGRPSGQHPELTGEFLEHLQAMPESDARAAMHRLQATSDMPAVLASIRGRIPTRRPSDIRAARSISPSMFSCIEFELSVSHRTVYPKLFPLNVSSIDLDDLGKTKTSSLGPILTTSQDLNRRSLGNGHPSSSQRDLGRASYYPTSSPVQTPRYCDSRLNYIDLRFWTAIPVNNEFAADAISFYLKNEHAIDGYFDADLFLGDLVAQKMDYCSALLVNTVLCISCICYTSTDLRASPFSLAFLHESISLLPSFRSVNSVTTISALNVLATATALIGRDQLTAELFANAQQMAEEMNLIGVPRGGPEAAKLRTLSPSMIRAASHAAWGTYNWMSVRSTMYLEALFTYAPALPIPNTPAVARKVRDRDNPWPSHPTPVYMGDTFSVLCHFWEFMQDVFSSYRAFEPEHPPLAFAETKFQELLAWADTLNEGMTRVQHSPAHVYIFQIFYHVGVLHIFRPLVKANKTTRLRSFASPDASPDTVFASSLRQLKRLMFDYVFCIQPRHYDAWLDAAAIHVSNSILQDSSSGSDNGGNRGSEGGASTDDGGWRFWFLICMKYWKEAVIAYPVLEDIAKASLSRAMNLGRLTGTEAQGFLQELKSRAKHHGEAEKATSAILDFESAISAGQKKQGFRVNELSQQFEELTLFSNMTTVLESRDAADNERV